MMFYYFDNNNSKVIIENYLLEHEHIIKIKKKLINFFYIFCNANNNKYLYDSHWFNYQNNLAIFDSNILNVAIFCRKNNIRKIYTCETCDESIIHMFATLRVEIIFSKKFNFVSKKIKSSRIFLVNFILAIYSIFSVLVLHCRNKKIIGIWTGDYCSGKFKCDPRVSELYRLVLNNKFQYVEFIRTGAISFNNIFYNLIQRRRLAIYYDSFIYFYNLKNKYSCSIGFFHYLMFRNNTPETSIKIVNFFKFIFKKINLKMLVPWFSSSRTIHLIAATSNTSIKTIGFMHGLSFISNMKHEYMPEYTGFSYPKIYKFGVYSDYFKNEFKKLSRLYEFVEISGPISYQPINYNLIKNNTHHSSNVLFISESHANVYEIIPFFDAYLTKNDFLYLKIRNFSTDIFYEKLKKISYKKLNKILLIKSPSPLCFDEFDVIIGSHSTMLLEAASNNKKILILSTNKHKDFFNIKNDANLSHLLVAQPRNLLNSISSAEKSVASKFCNKFYPKISGSKWLTSNILAIFN